jgi:AcrR family transcriptional regulator
MPTPGKSDRSARGDRYHHGDLRAALIDTAVELIAERGVRGFSLAEASRRLGVAVSAPYAHFADRDDLLAAVAVRAFGLFGAELALQTGDANPVDRLTAMARAYVRFAATRRPLFEVLYEAGLDKARHPEIEAAERLVTEAFDACVRELPGGDEPLAAALAYAVEATAHGHAALLLSEGTARAEGTELAEERAARATRALLAGRQMLCQAAGDHPQSGE